MLNTAHWRAAKIPEKTFNDESESMIPRQLSRSSSRRVALVRQGRPPGLTFRVTAKGGTWNSEEDRTGPLSGSPSSQVECVSREKCRCSQTAAFTDIWTEVALAKEQ